MSKFDEFRARLLDSDSIAIDTETDGFNADRLEGISFHNGKVGADFPTIGRYKVPVEKPLDLIREIMDKKIRMVYHNYPYDATVLRFAGIVLPYGTNVVDTLVMAWLHFEEGSHALKDLAKSVLNAKVAMTYTETRVAMQEMAVLYAEDTLQSEEERTAFILKYWPYNGKLKGVENAKWTPKVAKRMTELVSNQLSDPVEIMHPDLLMSKYAIGDARYTHGLYKHYLPILEEQGLSKAFFEMEMPVRELFAELRWNGLKVDVPRMNEMSTALQREMNISQQKIDRFAGRTLNLGSGDQLNELFFKKLAFKPAFNHPTGKPKKGADRGNYKLDEEWILKLAKVNRHPVMDEVLRWRKLAKMDGTYASKIPLMLDDRDYVHANMNSIGTVSGRACISGGTKIEVVRDLSKYPKGIPIEDVKVGDLAYCLDSNLQFTLKSVLHTWKTGVKEVIRVHWQGEGRHSTGYLDCTPEHKIRTLDGTYVRADSLVGGDHVLSLLLGVADSHRVVKIERLGKSVPVYDLEIQDSHNFIANEICVHNSSSDPNLQNIPRDDTLGKVLPGASFRKCFIADKSKDMTFLVSDLSQVELRFIAHFSKDRHMLSAYRKWNCRVCGKSGESAVYQVHCPECGEMGNDRILKDPNLKGFWHGLDIHQMTADKCGCTRNTAKMVNFGLIYGMGVKKLATQIDSSENAAFHIHEEFFDYYRSIMPFHAHTKNLLRTKGYIKVLSGRRRRFPKFNMPIEDWQREAMVREAVNVQIQGSSADLMKIILRNIRRDLQDPKWGMEDLGPEQLRTGTRTGICNQVHDELAIHIHKDLVKECGEMVVKHMRYSVPLTVPMDCSLGTGPDWGSCK